MTLAKVPAALIAAAVASIAVAAAAAPRDAVAAVGQWCGSGASAPDRLPEAVSSNQIHVIYAVPADAPDRFGERAPAIVADLAAVQAWWRGQDPSRVPRFDLFAFPGCPPTIASLDLSAVRLSREGSFYGGGDAFFPIVNELADAAAHANPFKKYLVYWDGPVENTRICGRGSVSPTNGGRSGYAIVYLQTCRPDVGNGSFMAATAAHELTHTFGAVPAQAPHRCPESAHTCDTTSDLMYPFLAPLQTLALDPGRDDYYGHSGSWWDVQDSPWLTRLDAPEHALAVEVVGSGAGTVRSDRPGVACPPGCSLPWPAGTQVVLTAEPGEATRFVGWSGACSGDGLACTVSMDAPKAVSARFALQVALAVRVVRRGGGGGTVQSTPEGIDACEDECEWEYDKGTRVTLVARSDRRSRFAGWSGACTGAGRCVVAVEAAAQVTATFAAAFDPLAVSLVGRGRVVSEPPGISCPGRCAATFRRGSTVRVRAAAADGWSFAEWRGACRGRAACYVKLEAARRVVAVFRKS